MSDRPSTHLIREARVAYDPFVLTPAEQYAARKRLQSVFKRDNKQTETQRAADAKRKRIEEEKAAEEKKRAGQIAQIDAYIKQTKSELSTPIRILKITAIYFGMSAAELQSPCRLTSHTRPRHIAAYLLRELTLLSMPQIGRKIGNRHHTTVLYQPA